MWRLDVDLGGGDVGNDRGLRSIDQHVAQVVEQFLGTILRWLQVEQLRVLKDGRQNVKLRVKESPSKRSE